MNQIRPIVIAAACALALSACASAPPAPRSSATASAPKLPPPSGAGTVAQPAAEASAYGAVNTGGTYPYGTAKTGAQAVDQGTSQGLARNAPQQANRESAEEIVVMGPDGTVWTHRSSADPAYQGDVDSCYAYARAQVAHDARIESDVASAFDSEADGFGLAALRGRMSNFERGNRMPALFNSCMTAKGYSRQ